MSSLLSHRCIHVSSSHFFFFFSFFSFPPTHTRLYLLFAEFQRALPLNRQFLSWDNPCRCLETFLSLLACLSPASDPNRHQPQGTGHDPRSPLRPATSSRASSSVKTDLKQGARVSPGPSSPALQKAGATLISSGQTKKSSPLSCLGYEKKSKKTHGGH